MATPFADAATLTPARERSLSEVLEDEPSVSLNAEYDHSTAALNFREFSFWNKEDNLGYSNLSIPHQKALQQYLAEHYGVISMTISLPFLILKCEPTPPPRHEQPFTVAGAISVWVQPGDFEVYSAVAGEKGRGQRLEISEDFAKDLRPGKIPSSETLQGLAREHFQDAIGISYILYGVIVELPAVDSNQFLKQLEELPEGFANANVDLSFRNGPLS